MKRTLVAAPGGAGTPGNLVDEIMTGVFGSLTDPMVMEREIVIAAAGEHNAQADAWRQWGEAFSNDLRESLTTVYGPRFSSSRLVKGAPYSAEVVTEMNQSLADGNVITHKTTGAVYRDGEGRTRQESGSDGKKPGTIYINDPVGGKYIVLMPGSKTAIVRPRAVAAPMAFTHEHVSRNKEVMRFDSKEVRIEDGKVFLDGKEVTEKVEIKTARGNDVRIENGKVFVNGKETTGSVRVTVPKVVVKHMDEKETGDGTRREEVRVQVIRSGDREITIPIPPVPPVPPVAALPPVPPLPPLPGVQTLRFESTAKLGKGVTTQLGAKDFDGVRAEGKSTVWTIPAGEIGNRNPIMITSESWYSPDLKVTVYSRYHDPRTGESIYRLAGIRRAEPSVALFSVPQDYTEKTRGKAEKEKDKK